ncbi:MAG: hypothetical protein ABSH48_01925 [Verrucomicrobiota bacterium]
MFSPDVRAADVFGEVSVSADAIYTGNTYHGYAEMRVVLENHSPTKTHVVTLIYPNRGFSSYGNSISRLSRTASVAPDSREVVSLLLPPLPAQGDGSIRVEVDGWQEGEVRAPNANNHCNFPWRGAGGLMANVLVSRSLDYDAVSRVFQAGGGAFTAAKAVGPPDAGGSGYQPNCWMPDARRHGVTNWLELDYAAPQPVSRVTIQETQSPVSDGSITLIGASGTNLAQVAMSTGRTTSSSTGWVQEYDLPETSQPIKTVRLAYGGKLAPYTISIDAVQISGSSGSQWAADARASSDNSASGMRMRPGGSAPDEVQCLRAESPVSEWSETWLAYSPFDAIVVNQGDVASMPPAVRAALDDYSQAGGNIVVLGTGELPALWHAAQTTKIHDGAECRTGFGSVFTFNSENPAALDALSVQRLRDTVRDTVRYFQALPSDSGAANGVMPVVENLKIPARGTVIIMLAFVITIGPVNLIYLNRIKRRTWMLWTIPAISLATTLVVFAYSLLREGVTPDVRIAGVTVLDQTSHRAATIGGEAFYCPLTPSGGLHFEFGTEATPLVSGNGPGTPREVDWTQSQLFRRGWVAARVPAHFHLRKPETRRERIQVLGENGRRQIVNSLGAPIKTLWFADAGMNLFQADNVPAGEKGGLIAYRQSQPSEKSGANGLLRSLGFAARADSLAGNVGRYLAPNTYVAVLEGNPFIENALGSAASAKRTKSTCVVFGILDLTETAGGGK